MKYDKGEFTIVPSKSARKGLHPTLQTVYTWLCDHSNEDMESWPSRTVLAEECGISVKTLDRATEKLISLGMISKDARFNQNEQTTNIYTVHVVEGGTKTTLGRDKNDIQNSTHLTQTNTIDKSIVTPPENTPAKIDKRNPDITEIVENFSSLLGLRLVNMPRQRQFGSLLLKAHGKEKVLAVIKFLAIVSQDEYAPRISDVEKLYYKWGDLEMYGRRKAAKMQQSQPVDLGDLK